MNKILLEPLLPAADDQPRASCSSCAKTGKVISSFLDNWRVTSEMFANGEQMCTGEREVDDGCPPLFQGSRINLHTAVEWNKLPPLEGRSFRFCICWWHAPRKGLREVLR